MTKALIGTVDLLDLQSGELVPASVYDGVDDKNVQDFLTGWRPILASKAGVLHQRGELSPETLGAINAQDFHWRWELKLAGRRDPLIWRSFAVEADGMTQGLMSVSLSPLSHGCTRDDMVYVDLLSSAPWNREGLVDVRRFKAVGAVLLATAASLSVDQGFAGRLGLHSLPQSEKWYRDKCLMTDKGTDPGKGGLRYFEMTEERAKAFLDHGS